MRNELGAPNATRDAAPTTTPSSRPRPGARPGSPPRPPREGVARLDARRRRALEGRVSELLRARRSSPDR